AVLVGTLVFAAAPRDAARGGADDGKPFPFAKTTILPSSGTYYVEGRVRIPKGVSITVQKNTVIAGRGESGGVIEVEGDLQIHGTPDKRDIVRDVTIEPQASFTQCLL